MNYENKTDEELLRLLETVGRTPPLALIRTCLGRQAGLTDGLLALLQAGLTAACEEGEDEDPRRYALVHAGKLLIAFREPAALPIFESFYASMAEAVQDELEWFGKDLAYYGGTAVPMLLRVINLDTNGEYHYGRSLATEALTIIAARHPDERDLIIAAFSAQLPRLNADGSVDAPPDHFDEQWINAVMALGDLKDEASRPQIEALLRQQLAVNDFISLADYQDQMKPGARSLADVDVQFDVIAFYQHMHELQKHIDQKALRQGLLQDQGFLPPAPAARPFQTRVGDWLSAKIAPAPKPAKIGRNDLCPCGSGLKYKKCHGKAGAPPLN